MKRLQHVKLTEAEKVAAAIAKQLRGGEILALIGPLGSGKTTFTKALGKTLRIKHRITSPTFTLMHAFPTRLTKSKSVTLYHLDLYRTKNFREASALGLTEFWGAPDTVTIIEWADKIKRHLPKKTYFFYFQHD